MTMNLTGTRIESSFNLIAAVRNTLASIGVVSSYTPHFSDKKY